LEVVLGKGAFVTDVDEFLGLASLPVKDPLKEIDYDVIDVEGKKFTSEEGPEPREWKDETFDY
jgi:hypothetical protein